MGWLNDMGNSSILIQHAVQVECVRLAAFSLSAEAPNAPPKFISAGAATKIDLGSPPHICGNGNDATKKSDHAHLGWSGINVSLMSFSQ